MSHYLFNFFCTTTGMIVLLYGVYLYIKKTPQLSGISKPQQPGKDASSGLYVESVLNLEPRKRLYVVRSGNERFLISTSLDKTELLTPLELGLEIVVPATDSALNGVATENASTVSGMATPSGFQYGSNWKERFHASLKMVLVERFTRLGGK